ncbi:MAG: biotin transporter BioY [Prochloraceae cyanobacterium]|nr:biotin transporter BioY [Prochloraceae cyanobacterium]
MEVKNSAIDPGIISEGKYIQKKYTMTSQDGIPNLKTNKSLLLNRDFPAGAGAKRNRQRLTISIPFQLLCALIGLLITIGGTFIKGYITGVPWNWAEGAIELRSLGVNYQIGAVLFAGCLGGKNAGAISQIAYLCIGLAFLPVFDRGGGIDYITEPGFGYLLGFIPGAWLCGWLAFGNKAKLESLFFSSICGLGIIHLFGIAYIIGLSYFERLTGNITALESIAQYSLYPLPGQLIIICAVAVVVFVLRRIMFY